MLYLETSILQSNTRTMTKSLRELPAFVLLCCSSIHFHFILVHDNIEDTYGDRGSSFLTLSRVLSWLSIPKACYGLHEATFLPKSTLKSTQQTVTPQDIKIRKPLSFFPSKMSETFGTSAGILSAMSWQRPCPLVQRSWQPA